MKTNNNVFNPIKEDKDGVIAKRMIWTSEALKIALKGLEDGRKLVANPFYENNTKLLKGDLVFQRTEEEKAEWKRCATDIIYFVNKYCKLMTPEGIKNVKLRDYQEHYLQHLMDNRLSIYLACRQCGKCNSFITNVLCKFDDDFWKKFGYKLKNKWDCRYYIKESDCYMIPIFELYNLYDNRLVWKIKYRLYKYLYKLICLKVKLQKKTLGNA
jgi:hypothetical protein